MTQRCTIVRMLAAAGIGGLLVARGAAPALATCTVTGDGTPFATIQSAVNAGASTIDFTGTCDPQVNIWYRPFVSLVGTSEETPADNVITQGMSVVGSPVWITNVQIGGDTSVNYLTGIVFSDGAKVSVFNSTIQPTLQGVAVVRGSGALFFNSSIHGRAGSTANFDPDLKNEACNVCALDNSMIRLTDTTVTMNESNGKIGTLVAGRNSELLLRGGNSITNTGSLAAVQVFFHSSLRQDDPEIETPPSFDRTPDSITGGMQVGSMSFADLRDLTISGNVTVGLNSVLRFGGTSDFGSEPADIVIQGNVTASKQSIIDFQSAGPTVMGNVACSDKESHLAGSPTITGTNTCTGF